MVQDGGQSSREEKGENRGILIREERWRAVEDGEGERREGGL